MQLLAADGANMEDSRVKKRRRALEHLGPALPEGISPQTNTFPLFPNYFELGFHHSRLRVLTQIHREGTKLLSLIFNWGVILDHQPNGDSTSDKALHKPSALRIKPQFLNWSFRAFSDQALADVSGPITHHCSTEPLSLAALHCQILE